MKEAIQKAIEGGWDKKRMLGSWGDVDVDIHEWAWLDPSFWQALGKAMGWDNHNQITMSLPEEGQERRKEIIRLEETVGVLVKFVGTGKVIVSPYTKGLYWKDVWHLFIDHLAEGKDPDSFFQTLLSN